VVALAISVCVLTRGRPEVQWNGAFSEDLVQVTWRVRALRRSIVGPTAGWDGGVQRIRGRIDRLETKVQEEEWGRETML
jgi:hypothetical protein